jgi:hypothetical protein
LWLRCVAKGGQLLAEVEVGWNDAGDQPGIATESKVLDRPLDKNENPALVCHEIREVNEGPDQPRRQSGKLPAENLSHCSRAADYGKRSFVEIVKRGKLRMAVCFRKMAFAAYAPPCMATCASPGKGLPRASVEEARSPTT